MIFKNSSTESYESNSRSINRRHQPPSQFLTITSESVAMKVQVSGSTSAAEVKEDAHYDGQRVVPELAILQAMYKGRLPDLMMDTRSTQAAAASSVTSTSTITTPAAAVSMAASAPGDASSAYTFYSYQQQSAPVPTCYYPSYSVDPTVVSKG